MTVAAELLVRVGADTSQAERGLGNFSNRMSSIASSMQGVGLRLTAGITAPLTGMALVAVNAASDLEESMNKVNVVFGDSATEIQAWASTAATSFGLSRQAALEAVGTFGNMFTAMGMGQDAAGDMSRGVVQLAADLASFNNIPVDVALEKLRAGLVGETEPLRSLGVNLDAASVKAYALSHGLARSTDELTPAALAQARYAMILEQTASAQGDFARTSDGLANSLRITKAQVQDAAAKLGQQLLPIALRVVQAISRLVDWFSNMPAPMQRVILIVGALAAAIGPLLMAIGSIVGGISALAPILGAIGGVIGGVVAAIGAAIGPVLIIIGLVIAAVILLKRAFDTNFLGIRDIVRAVWTAIQSIFGQIQRIIEAFFAFLNGEYTWDQFVTIVEDAMILIKDAISEAWDKIHTIIVTAWERIKTALIEGIARFIAPLVGGMDRARELVATAFERIGQVLAGMWENAKTVVATAWEFIKGIIRSATEAIRGIIAVFVQIISGDWSGAWETIKTTVTRVWEEIKTGISSALAVIGPAIQTAWQNIKTGVTEKVEQLKVGIAQKWEAIKAGASEKWEAVKEKITGIVTAIKDFVVNTLGELVQKAIELFSRLIGALTGGGGGGGGNPFTIDFTALIASLMTLRAEWTLTQDHIIAAIAVITAAVTTWLATSQATITATWTTIQTFLLTTWTMLLTAYQLHLTTTYAALMLNLQQTQAAIILAWTTIQTFLIVTWAAIKQQYFTELLSMLATTRQTNQWILQDHKRVWPQIQATAIGAAQQMKTGVVAAFNEMKAAVAAVLSAMAASAHAAGVAIGNAVAAGIYASIPAAVAAAQALAAAVDAVLPHSDAKEGPLSHLSEVGPAIVLSIAHGIKDTLGAVNKPMMALAAAIKPSVPTKPDFGPYKPMFGLGGGVGPTRFNPNTKPFEPVKPPMPPVKPPMPGPIGGLGGGVGPDRPDKCITINIYNPTGKPSEESIMIALKKLAAIGLLEPV